ncbi:MAG: hypothetical protein CME06_09140, partial [Gemmatimonadetes bacterium]|nr:hypothetical protein [Gemmatimonadota bacterium]
FSLGSLIRGVLAGGAMRAADRVEVSTPGAGGVGDPGGIAGLVDELLARDPAKRPDSAHEVACRLGRALAPRRGAREEDAAPLVLGARRGVEWKLLLAVGRLVAGRGGGGIALVGPAGSGRRSLLRIAEIFAKGLGGQCRSNPEGAAMADRTSGSSRPTLLTFDPGEDRSVSMQLSRAARLPEVLAIAGLKREPADPDLRALRLGPLDLGASVRLGKSLLRTSRLPKGAAVGTAGPLQPGAWRERLERAQVRRNDLGEVSSISIGSVEAPPAAPAIGPALVGFCGGLLPAPRVEALLRNHGAESEGTTGDHLRDRSPGLVFRWSERALGREVAKTLAKAAAGALLEAESKGGIDRRRRAAWVLRSVGALGAHPDLARDVAGEDLRLGRPRSAVALARSVLPALEAGTQSHDSLLAIAARAARQLGRPRWALRWIERRAPRPGGGLRESPMLTIERLEALILCGSVEAAWDAAGGLRDRFDRADPAACLVVARIAQLRGDEAATRRSAGAALRRARSNDPGAVARALGILATSDLGSGDLFRAARRSRAALAIRRRLEDSAGVAASLVQLADVDSARRDHASARRRLDEALDLRLSSGQVAGAADILERIGKIDASTGDAAAARAGFARALNLRERLRDDAGAAAARHNLGILALRAGDAPAARRASNAAADLFGRLGDLHAELAARLQAALAAESLGRRRDALVELRGVLRRRRRAGDERGLVVALKHLSDLLGRGGHPARAARLAWIAAFRVGGGDDASRRNQLLLDAAAAELDAGRIDRVWSALSGVVLEASGAEIVLQATLLKELAGAPALSAERLARLAEQAGLRAHPTLAADAAVRLARADRPELARSILNGIGDLPSNLFAAISVDLAWIELHLAIDARSTDRSRLIRARREVDRIGLPRQGALCHLLEAALLDRAGRPDAAAHHLDEAALLLGPPPRYPDLRLRVARHRRRLRPGSPDRRQHLALVRVTDLLGSIEDPEKLFSAILRVVLDTVAAERGVLTLREGDTENFEIAVARNVERHAMEDVRRISRTILGRAYREGAVLHSSNALEDDEFSGLRSVQLYRIVSFACAPLVVGGRTIGTIYVDKRSKEGAFSSNDLGFLASLARISAIALEHARLHDRLKTQAGALRREMAAIYGIESLIHRSKPLERVMTQARRVIDVDTPILLLGETGVGKSVIARAIHYSGARAAAPFVDLDCGAIPEDLIESELFGHRRGAFTDAASDRAGAFRQADGGTLLLDEIGNLPASGQAKLLRVLQDGRVRPLGGDEAVRVDVRVICATNTDLDRRVAERSFRGDLLFRINTIPLARRRRRLSVDRALQHRRRSDRSERVVAGRRLADWGDRGARLRDRRPAGPNRSRPGRTVLQCVLQRAERLRGRRDDHRSGRCRPGLGCPRLRSRAARRRRFGRRLDQLPPGTRRRRRRLHARTDGRPLGRAGWELRAQHAARALRHARGPELRLPGDDSYLPPARSIRAGRGGDDRRVGRESHESTPGDFSVEGAGAPP